MQKKIARSPSWSESSRRARNLLNNLFISDRSLRAGERGACLSWVLLPPNKIFQDQTWSRLPHSVQLCRSLQLQSINISISDVCEHQFRPRLSFILSLSKNYYIKKTQFVEERRVVWYNYQYLFLLTWVTGLTASQRWHCQCSGSALMNECFSEGLSRTAPTTNFGFSSDIQVHQCTSNTNYSKEVSLWWWKEILKTHGFRFEEAIL